MFKCSWHSASRQKELMAHSTMSGENTSLEVFREGDRLSRGVVVPIMSVVSCTHRFGA